MTAFVCIHCIDDVEFDLSSISVYQSYVYLAWNDNRSGLMQCYFTFSSDYGVTWAWQGPLSQVTTSTSYSPEVHALANGVAVSWATEFNGPSDYQIWWALSTNYGQNFTAPSIVNHMAATYPVVLVDLPNIHFAWGGPFNTLLDYQFSSDNGVNWQNPVVLANLTTGGAASTCWGCVLGIPSMALAAVSCVL